MECPFLQNGKKYKLIPHILNCHNDKRYSILYLINKGFKYEKIMGNCKDPSKKGFIYEIIVISLESFH